MIKDNIKANREFPTLRSEISGTINKQRNKMTKIKDSPWSNIPNVKDFKVIPGSLDGLGYIMGIFKKSKAEIEFTKGKNSKSNRYQKYTENLLESLILQKKVNEYGKLSRLLIKNSKVYRILAINHVYYGGYKKKKLGFILALNDQVNVIAKQEKAPPIEISRVYIPKADNKGRPLGVPSPAGRVYGHLYLNFLYLSLRHKLSKHQHAYKPGFSIYTAGRDVIDKLESNSIYEFDLSKFFDRVSTTKIGNALVYLGVPREEATYIYDMIRSYHLPYPKECKDPDEAETIRLRNIGKNEQEKHFLNGFGSKDEPKERVAVKDLPAVSPINLQGNSYGGIPQGFPMSPLLACLVLEHTLLDPEFYEIKGSAVMYADDGLMFFESNPPFEDNRLLPIHRIRQRRQEACGIHFNYDKSRGIKLNNQWRGEIKFLGIRLKPKENIIQSESRKNPPKEMPSKYLTLFELLKERSSEKGDLSLTEYKANEKALESFFLPEPRQRLSEFIKSRYFETIGSRMGTLDPNALIKGSQDLKWVPHSGMEIRTKFENLDFFNASTRASQGMLNNLRM